MNLGTISRVEESYAKIVPIADEAAVLFYERLFELSPALRPYFGGDMEAQRCKLMATLQFAVNSLREPDALLPAIRAMGARHAGYGAHAAHYPLVRDALLWMLEACLGEEFGSADHRAWTDVLNLIAGQMQSADPVG
jgi:hemoglobin-like flavoprotein